MACRKYSRCVVGSRKNDPRTACDARNKRIEPKTCHQEVARILHKLPPERQGADQLPRHRLTATNRPPNEREGQAMHEGWHPDAAKGEMHGVVNRMAGKLPLHQAVGAPLPKQIVEVKPAFLSFERSQIVRQIVIDKANAPCILRRQGCLYRDLVVCAGHDDELRQMRKLEHPVPPDALLRPLAGFATIGGDKNTTRLHSKGSRLYPKLSKSSP